MVSGRRLLELLCTWCYVVRALGVLHAHVHMARWQDGGWLHLPA